MAGDPTGSLTPRQREVLHLLAEGRSAKEIASILSISVRTVEFHKYQMMETLDLHSSAELIHFDIKHNLCAKPGGERHCGEHDFREGGAPHVTGRSFVL